MENTQENCIFCKIVRGELPSEKIYEDSDTLVLLDIMPVNRGHMLVIPKAHFVNAFDLPPDIFCKMTGTAQKMAHAVAGSLGTENVNITMNNGEHSGQKVFHAHIHVIPRYENDGHGLWHGRPYIDDEAKKFADKIKNAL